MKNNKFYLFLFVIILSLVSIAQPDFSFLGAPEVSKREAAAISDAIKLSKTDIALSKKILEEAAENKWAGAAVFFNLANLSFGDGEFARAAELYSKAVDKSPRFFQARKNLGFALAKLGKKSEAADALKKALALCGGSDTQILLYFAADATMRKNFASALSFLNQAEIFDTENAEVLGAKADCLIELGKSAEAREYARGFLGKNPRDIRAWRVLVHSFIVENDDISAISALESIRAFKLSDDGLDSLLAGLYLRGGAVRKACDIYGASGDAKLRKAGLTNCATFFASSGDFGEAEKICDALLSESKSAEILRLKAVCASRRGDCADARIFLRKFSAENPCDIAVKFELARICFSDGNIVEAKRLYADCLKDKNFRCAALSGLMNSAVKEGDLSRAVYFAEKISGEYPNVEISEFLTKLKKVRYVEKSAR